MKASVPRRLPEPHVPSLEPKLKEQRAPILDIQFSEQEGQTESTTTFQASAQVHRGHIHSLSVGQSKSHNQAWDQWGRQL